MKIHIGGEETHPDWKILDIEQRPEVDYVCDASDLSQFADDSIDVIYASHVLEHFHYQLHNELHLTLTEWCRVIKPDGKLMLSVPNLRTLCWLYLHPDLNADERLYLMRVMFGGQIDQYDIHRAGLDIDILTTYLREAGFRAYERVDEFNLFQDSSSIRFLGYLISLNLIVTK